MGKGSLNKKQENIPGPGHYHINSSLPKNLPLSFTKQSKDSIFNKVDHNPGPGYYHL
jgi:hypothetical protein